MNTSDFDSFVKLAATETSAMVCARNVKGACGGSSGQQASGHLRGLKLAMEGAFARLAAVRWCQALLGKFRD
jgi:hypothetical protein